MTSINKSLHITKYEDKEFPLYAYDIPVDETGVQGLWTRTDLTGALCKVKVRDDQGNIVIDKSSLVSSEITINPDQISPSTRGTATLFLSRADTELLVIGTTYYYDFWVLDAAAKWKNILSKERFLLSDGGDPTV